MAFYIKKTVLMVTAIMFIAGIIVPASFGSCGKCGVAASPDAQPAAMVKNPCDKPKGDPLRKLGRGIANCFTFPIEVPNQISRINNSDGPVAAMTYGVVKGITMGIFRALVGVYEVVSFPLPFPEWYRPIMTDPEFMLEHCNE